MQREIVKINHDLCNGCGLCIPNCHEGALQIIEGKAYLISDLMCDGLGACLGHCPIGAITIEKREAEPYNEKEVIAFMVKKGKSVVKAHLLHLLEHNEVDFFNEGIEYLKENEKVINFDINDLIAGLVQNNEPENKDKSCGCLGSQPISFNKSKNVVEKGIIFETSSELTHWPVQLHLINPRASYFVGTDLLLASDCSAFAAGNFHRKFLAGKTLAVACPKLDSGIDTYISKIQMLIDDAKINTITVLMMEVSCCGGLLQIVQHAIKNASRRVPIKMIILSIKGEIIQEEWV